MNKQRIAEIAERVARGLAAGSDRRWFRDILLSNLGRYRKFVENLRVAPASGKYDYKFSFDLSPDADSYVYMRLVDMLNNTESFPGGDDVVYHVWDANTSGSQESGDIKFTGTLAIHRQ